jgi:hypothetical protein
VEYADGILTVNDPCAGRDLRSVRISGMAAVSASPQPVRGTLHLRIADGHAHDVRVEMFDVLGSLVWGVQHAVRSEAAFDVEGVPPGCYILQVSAGQDRRTMTIIVE